MSNVQSPVPSAAAIRRRGSGKRFIAVAVIVVAALGFLIFRGLGDATEYFRTASEAVAQRQTLGEKRFRLEGTVVPGTIKDNGAITNFSVADKGVTVAVANTGQPLGIFRENIPVVLEGHFANGSDVFQSDRILVKHSSDYQEEHPDRVSGAANQ